MKMIGLARLGRSAETRYTTNGDPVTSFSAAYNFGRKGDDGKRPTQWIECSIWGDRGEKLAQHLTKGTALFLCLDDVHVETYDKRDGGTGHKLVGRVDSVEFAGSRESGGDDRQQRAPSPAPAPKSGAKPAAKQSTAFDDMDNDVPF